MNWKEKVNEQIQLMGHRNWIVVVDAAYPLQSSKGVLTMFSDDDFYETVGYISNAISKSNHVNANIYLDKELDYMEEDQVPGISEYRSQMATLIKSEKTESILHEELIGMLDKVAEQFNVLVIKTDLVLPYTSMFFELDCGYWNANKESELRNRMKIQ